jgi:N-succinyldiaminopimelate aminotransferase
VSVRRLEDIPGFNIDRIAAAAGDDPDVLRMENLDTDVPPPTEAVEATRAAVGTDDANSWLPFTGRDDLKDAVAAFIERRGGPRYDGRREIVITCGEGDAMVDALFCLTDPGDEVVLTDPTYAGMLNRVRLVGAVPRLVPLYVDDGEWRLDLDALRAAVTERTRVVFVNNASFPSGWVASEDEWGAVASICGDQDVRLLYWAGFEGVLFDGRTVQHPAALEGMRDRTVTIGSPTLEQRMIAWRIGWIVAPGGLVDDVSRVHIYNGLVPSGFNQIGTRVALSLADSSTACRRCAPPGRGRFCSTWRRWDLIAWTHRTACWSRRSPQPRCEAGEVTSPIGTSASSSATSRSNASQGSASACTPRLASRARCCG